MGAKGSSDMGFMWIRGFLGASIPCMKGVHRSASCTLYEGYWLHHTRFSIYFLLNVFRSTVYDYYCRSAVSSAPVMLPVSKSSSNPQALVWPVAPVVLRVDMCSACHTDWIHIIRKIEDVLSPRPFLFDRDYRLNLQSHG